jgi:uncharacterized protein (DUF1800 family)
MKRDVFGALAAALLLTAASTGAGEKDARTPSLSKEQRIAHFVNRFTLGAPPELVAEVRRLGIERWLDAQFEDRKRSTPALEKRLAKLPSIDLMSREIMWQYVKPIPSDATPEQRRSLQRLRGIPRKELRDSVIYHAVYGPNPVREVAADFWRNHFCVAMDKVRVRYFGTEYERDVIREGVFGSFGVLLYRSAQHPAMLVYLDNVVSRRPPTKAELKKIEMQVRLRTKSKERGREASDIAAQRGLNENYARELLELHTLGVDNYYTQRDVENVAEALTGWTIWNDPSEPIMFRFRPEMHAQGDKHFLGRLIQRNPDNMEAEGEKILDTLIKHKGTARFISWKLCRYFVRDDPPDDLVARVAAAFQKNKGDLPSVYRAIVADEEFFAARNYRAKLKRPFEFVVGALRVTRAQIDRCDGIHRALGAMAESIYECKDPTGYYDHAESWRDPGAFAVRWKFAMDLATGKIPGVTIPESLYRGLDAGKPETWKDELVARLLPGGLTARTSGILDRIIAKRVEARPDAPVEEMMPQIVGMILGCPEFQQQ